MAAEERYRLAPDLEVVGRIAAANSWLLRAGDQALLIDCGDERLPAWLAELGLPDPQTILHSHCQEEHCREADAFPEARILVPLGERERAGDPQAWQRDARTRWDDPADWERSLGQERYGVAGAITRFPPQQPLRVTGELCDGDRLPIGAYQLRVIALPAHDRAALGFVLEDAGRPLAIFCGDLFRAPGVLVNAYDLEHRYSQLCLDEIPPLLRALAALECPLILPSTGPGMRDGDERARALAQHIDDYHRALRWGADDHRAPSPAVRRRWRRWVELLPGCWQIDQFGNCILFIDRDGNGLLIDPGPCDFDNPRREEDFLADIDGFVAEHGLRRIDAMLLTHFHGDHYDLAPLLRQRFPAARLVAAAQVAAVVDHPERWNRPCTLPWYGQGRAEACDLRLPEGEDWDWRGHRIAVGSLLGHCSPHALYLLDWAGTRVALTGDTVQSRGESWSLLYACANGATPEDGLRSMQALLRADAALNLGGHSSRFAEPRSCYLHSLHRMQHALPYLRAIFPDGDLERAFRRPACSFFPAEEPVA